MKNILLSIIIPTFNRPERLYDLLKKITNFSNSENIEVVIGDDNPSSVKTENMVKKFHDTRIKYFHNEVNLGMDGNILKIIRRTSGKFIFLMMDDDEIEMNSIPWILNTIRKKRDLSQICGNIGHRNPTYKNRYYPFFFKYEFKKRKFKKGYESLYYLLFHYPHGSGIVLKRESLNLNQALKYCGFLWIQQILIAQAMQEGDTILSSKIFAYTGREDYPSDQPLIRGKGWWYPINQINQTNLRIKVIQDLVNGHNIIKKILLKRQINHLVRSFLAVFNYYKFPSELKDILNSYIQGFAIILSNRISWSPIFWFELLIRYLFLFFRNKRNEILYQKLIGRYFKKNWN